MAFNPFEYVNLFSGVDGISRRLAYKVGLRMQEKYPKTSDRLITWALRN